MSQHDARTTATMPLPSSSEDEQPETPRNSALVDDPVAASAWEEDPPRVPVFRWRLVGSAVMVLVVAVAAWWAVTWLMRPSAPDSVPVDAHGVIGSAEEGPGADAPGTDGTADGRNDAHGDRAGEGDGPSSGDRGAGAADRNGASGAEKGAAAGDEEGDPAAAPRVRVHVIGEVRSPGVVTVPADARTADAIAAAGGTTRAAEAERINLAAPLIDGQQVLVPGDQTTEEQLESVQAQAHAVPGTGPDKDPRLNSAHGAGSAGGAADAEAGGVGGSAGADQAQDGQDVGSGSAGAVDLNTADSTALQTLPGVGPATAEKIIAHREQVGPFQSLTDLDAVSGIGPATLERLAPLVTW